MTHADHDTTQRMIRDMQDDIMLGTPAAIPVPPPRLETTPEFPEPGIYFGMSEAAYHAVPALSASGIKRLSESTHDFWQGSWMDPDATEQSNRWFDFGKAIHALVLEGEAVFASRYAPAISKDDYVDEDGNSVLLETNDQIKAAIVERKHTPTVKGYDDNTRNARKEDWIAQLLDIDPDAPIWDRIVQRHERSNAGKETLDDHAMRRILIAARMIDNDPDARELLTGGYSEVSLFWYSKATGAAMSP